MSVTFDFTGKVALVTGSSSGIGAAIAILFAKSGANVVVTGRNAANVQSVAKQCSDVSPKKSKPLEVVADVSKEDDCKRLIDTTVKHFGRIDILVNNAGTIMPTKITDTDYMDKYRNLLGINLDSAVYLTHLSVEQLERTKGNIINVSSVISTSVLPGGSNYCMSKSAMNMFTKCMAVELGSKGIRVNSIDPGCVRTNIISGMGVPKERAAMAWDKIGSYYPVGRLGEGIDIANAVLFLSSNSASFITGIVLVADGGHLAANVDMASAMTD